MGEITSEFEFLESHDKEISIEEESKKLIEYAKQFQENGAKRLNKTFQGLTFSSICKGIDICESNVMPWEHVKFTLNVNELKDINGSKILEFSVPFFVEELESIGDKDGTEFGYNHTTHNNLKSIFITKNVMIISSATFLLYRKLEHVTFEKGSKLVYLGPQSFLGCSSLHKLDLRNCTELETLANNLFEDSAVETLKISSNIQTISRRTFDNSNVKFVYVDNHRYKIDVFIEKLEANNYEPFWYSSKYMEDIVW